MPPLAAIEEVSFTHADAEVALVEQLGVQDSSQENNKVWQAESRQNRIFPKSDASEEEYVDGFHVTIC